MTDVRKEEACLPAGHIMDAIDPSQIALPLEVERPRSLEEMPSSTLPPPPPSQHFEMGSSFFLPTGLAAPGPSPTKIVPAAAEITMVDAPPFASTARAQLSHARSGQTARSVLFIYPPYVDEQTVLFCYEHAQHTMLLPSDVLTILLASPSGRDARSESLEEQTFIAGEGIKDALQEIRVTAENFVEATRMVNERCPFMHRLFAETDLGDKQFMVKVYECENLKWLLQQELQIPHGEKGYDLVVMPSYRSESSRNKELENFLLQTSPVTVTILRQ